MTTLRLHAPPPARVPLPAGSAVRGLDHLLGPFTGGLLTFYDAVPTPGQQKLLEIDVLNPHYPGFYRSSNRKMPSDDQDPIPVYFLAVKADTTFVFPFRLGPLPPGELAETRDGRRK